MIQQDLAEDIELKWNRIQKTMQQIGMDGCLLTIDVNLFYVTGRIFNGYFYLPQEGKPFFFIKRPNGLTGKNLFYIRKPEQIADIFTENGIAMPEKLLMEGDEIPYNEYIRLQAVFRPKETGNATALLRKMRSIKTPAEIEQFRFSARKHAETYAEISSCFRVGMTDLEFQNEIERKMRKNGSIGLFRTFGSNMDIYMGSILAGENAEYPSPFDFALGREGMNPSLPIGANGTVLKDGTAIMVDMAGNFSAYMTDMTRVFSVGKLSGLAYKAHQVSLAVQQEIEQIAKPGTPCSELYTIAAGLAEKEELSAYFMGTKQQAKFVGHGIGIQINELPVLTPRSKEVLEPIWYLP